MRRPLIPLAAILALVCLGSAPAQAAEPQIEPVVEGAEFPTNIAFGPGGSMYYTEKDTGRIREMNADGELLDEPVATFDVTGGGETGLLGIAPYGDWLYVYYSDAASGKNVIARLDTSADNPQPEIVAELLPTANGYHNGGDVTFGTDGMLYATVGEMHEADRAQDPQDLGGKVIRLTPGGDVPSNNPFGADNPAWSMGHRNSFGICFDPETGDLWETENGPDSHDEVNLIEAGGNYGWPQVMGPGGAPDFIDPVVDFPEIVAPTGCAVWGHTLWFGDFSGGRLYRLPVTAPRPPQAEVVAQLPSGITDVQRGPGDALYIATVDGIYRLTVAPPAGVDATHVAAPPKTDFTGERSLSFPAVAASLLALVIVLIGGLWFAMIRRREEAEGDLEEAAEAQAEAQAEAAGEEPSPPVA
jgi:glucose/arabinose dehydrogenase